MADFEQIDGFDHYGTTPSELTLAYNSVNTAGMSLVAGRFTDRGLQQDANVNSLVSLTISARSTVLIGFAFKPIRAFTAAPFAIIDWRDAGSLQMGIGVDASGHLIVFRGSGAFGAPGTTVATSTNALTQNAWVYIEVKIFISDTVGTAEVKVGGTNVGWINATGLDTKATANATIDSLNFRVGGTSFDAFGGIFDDFYMNASGDGTFRGERRVFTLAPDADGDTDQWTTSTGVSHFALVDEDPENGDTDYVEDSVVGHRELFNFAALPSNPSVIDGVALWGCLRKDDAGSKSEVPTIKSGSSVGQAASEALTTSYVWYRKTFGTDPATSQPFNKAGVDALQGGFDVGA